MAYREQRQLQLAEQLQEQWQSLQDVANVSSRGGTSSHYKYVPAPVNYRSSMPNLQLHEGQKRRPPPPPIPPSKPSRLVEQMQRDVTIRLAFDDLIIWTFICCTIATGLHKPSFSFDTYVDVGRLHGNVTMRRVSVARDLALFRAQNFPIARRSDLRNARFNSTFVCQYGCFRDAQKQQDSVGGLDSPTGGRRTRSQRLCDYPGESRRPADDEGDTSRSERRAETTHRQGGPVGSAQKERRPSWHSGIQLSTLAHSGTYPFFSLIYKKNLSKNVIRDARVDLKRTCT